jgi:uncharacterized membrane protein
MTYNTLLTLHIISVIGLLGIGGGSAFYKFMADRSKNLEVIVHTNKMVVLADWLFTTPAVVAQPITGVMLVKLMGYSFDTWWLLLSVNIYVFSIVLWLLAVWLQVLMKRMAMKAQKASISLGADYYRLVNYWIGLGFFSALGMGAIFYLMIFKI